jgi:hypothetical protein
MADLSPPDGFSLLANQRQFQRLSDKESSEFGRKLSTKKVLHSNIYLSEKVPLSQKLWFHREVQ